MTAAQKTVRSDPRVEVTAAPPFYRDFTSFEEALTAVRVVEAAIRRHVDDTQEIRVVWETRTVCAHCEEPVATGYFDDGSPGCCDAAVAEHEAGQVVP